MFIYAFYQRSEIQLQRQDDRVRLSATGYTTSTEIVLKRKQQI